MLYFCVYMEPGIPTSFIPKRPIESSTESSSSKGKSVGILSLLTGVVVIGTVLAFVAVYLYEQQLAAQKKNLEESIATARDGIGTDFVADMKRLDSRINGVEQLIKSHIVVTPLFKDLEAHTLRSVQYKDFAYSFTADEKTKASQVKVDLSGTARSYAAIALQSDAFSESTLIKNPVFSNLTLEDKTKAINFKLSFTVDSSALSYQTFIDSTTKKTTQTNTSTSNNQTTP